MTYLRCDWCGETTLGASGEHYHSRCLKERLESEMRQPDEMKRLRGAVRKYGIDAEEYMRMLADQRYRCAICLKPPSGLRGKSGGQWKRFHVDHDHRTGFVRGLLCFSCNSELLPASRNNPEVLRRASEYLVRSQTAQGKETQ